MQPYRRRALLSLGALMLAGRAAAQGAGGGDVIVRINLPGPGSLPFLPLELIPALGFDREMGARLMLRYHPSGIRALEDALAGNADFAALGFPTLPVLKTHGKDVVGIAPIAGVQHTFQVLVRKDLAGSIKRLESLRGKTIGVSTGSTNSKTYMQMLMEIMLTSHGVRSSEIRWLGTGQNWESISGALISKAADAVLCEQPFPQRLVKEGLGVPIADLNDPQLQARVTGIDALRSVIAASRLLLSRPEGQHKAELMVRMLRRTLVWLQTTPPETVAGHAQPQDRVQRDEIATILRKTPRIYSTDARFITTQVDLADVFLKAALGNAAPAIPAASLMDDRWAGRR
jgi:NitT/TauT family transport system substrate-binding protein